ncbi:unnamed protein product [Triticum turgidum subsp. durum]|uniref:NAD(P)H dehydrogenase (quinone) n=1 Tax=Triticum turgidum subsp. durum TaxID=4567 RepID=A0A9R0VCZ2_TRITD|nr:unnamed protein product [Triticum turgidum subsp. durum]
MAVKVYVVYYSMYGHVAKLADEIKKGASSVEGVEVKVWQVPEILNEEVLGKMGAPPKTDVPVISPQELAEADGVLFGFPTRFGMMAAQMKAFFDATGGLWREQSLAGDGSRWPSEMELEHAFHQGKYFAGIAKKFKGSSA